MAASGPTLRAARAALLSVVNSCVRDYLTQFETDRLVPEIAEQEPHVLRLSLAQDDAERFAMLFGPVRSQPQDSVSSA